MKYIYYSVAFILMLAMSISCNSAHDHEHEGHEHAEEVGHDEDEHDHDHEGIVFTHEQAESAGLKTEIVKTEPFENVIKCTGRIVASPGSERTLSSPASGILATRGGALTDGMPVAAGQVLYTISSKGTEQSDRSAALRIRYEAAKREYERAKPLAADRIITQAELTALEEAYRSAEAELRSVSNRAAGGNIGIASPISGYLVEQIARPGDFVAEGAPIATVSQNRRIQLRADVPQQYVNLIPEVVSANFTMPSGTSYSLASLGGRKVSAAQTTGSAAGYVPVMFEFDNPGGMFPGTYVETYLLCKTRTEAISVPVSALTEEQGLYFVYVRTGDHEYRKQEVKLGASNGKRVEILSGLKSGDEVVTEAVIHLKLAANTGQIPEGHSHNH